MPRTHPFRLLAALMAMAVALVWGIPSRSDAAPLNAGAATSAATYIASQLKSDGAGGTYLEALDWSGTAAPSASYTAEAVLSLVAAGGHAADVAAMDTWLKSQAAAYGTSAGAAAKLVLAAVAAGSDPASYGTGGNLIAKITPAADGALSSWSKDAFTQSLGILALVRAGAPVPASVTTYLLGLQGADGSFGYDDYSTGAYTPDPDTTALALQALAALAPSSATAKSAAVKARDWLVSKRTAQGYWNAYSPSNTAGYAGTALLLVGSPVTTTAAWLGTQQQADGGLPATLNGTGSDLYATIQAILLFAGESLLSVGPGGVDLVSLTTPSSSAPASSPASSAPASSAPASSQPASSAPASSAPASSQPASSAPASSAASSQPASSTPATSAPASSANPSTPSAAPSTPAATTVITLSATTVTQGTTVTVTGSGFTSTVRGTVRSTPIDLGTATPNAAGTVTFTFSTATLTPGSHTVTLASAESTAVASFTVTSTGTLAAAGSDVPPLAIAAAVILLIGGVGLVVAGRGRA